ncbi:MAG: hypothetical protein CMK07_01115 [Ponticaulis sp.]|nr:hypothetical protein [Ponticaulis sp.]
MKYILATTAIAAAMVTPAFATPPETDDTVKIETEVKTDNTLDLDIPNVDVTPGAEVIEAGYTDDHDWIGTGVLDADMESVGEVERVNINEMGEIETIIVETGSVLDIGGREIEVSGDDYVAIADEDGDAKIQLTMTAMAFTQMPDFDEDTVSDFPTSDDDLFDGVDEPAEIDGESDVEININ